MYKRQIADGAIAFIKAKMDGGQDREPFTNPASVAILNTMGSESNRPMNDLIMAGFFMIASMVVNEAFDTAQRTSRGYDYKLFLASVDGILTGHDFAPLKSLSQKFCDVSVIRND